MKSESAIVASVIVLFLLAVLLYGVTIISSDVIGSNITNDTTLARVYVWNTEPNISKVVISPSPVDLNPGGIVVVNCTGYVWDYNGWDDIRFLNATFYHIDESYGADADDNNYHYTNSTGNCTQVSGTSNNVTCVASFRVWYYASNGTWICNMTIGDLGGTATERIHYFNRSNHASVYINTVLGINTSEEIDYGNLSVTETSSYIPANVTNWGNVPINISVRGYGGTNESVPGVGNLSMICEFGNITHGYQRYSTNMSIAYENMTNLSNTSTLIPDFTLPVRTNDAAYGSDNNVTYWKIQIPLTVGGHCNGTIQFNAIDAS